MNTNRKKLVVQISVGISGIVWVYLLLLYYTGLDPTDVMGYGILAFFLLLPAAALFASLAVSVVGFRWRWVFPLCFGAAEMLLNFLISNTLSGFLLFLLPTAASLIGIGIGALIRRAVLHHRGHSADTGGSSSFDRSLLEPAIRCSICNGEQVAGFVDRKTGKFQEVAMIASEEDLEQFLKTYQISRQELKKIF